MGERYEMQDKIPWQLQRINQVKTEKSGQGFLWQNECYIRSGLKWSTNRREIVKIAMGGRSKGKGAYYKGLEHKSVTELWLQGWSLRNIALKHNVTVEYVESVIRDTWGKL